MVKTVHLFMIDYYRLSLVEVISFHLVYMLFMDVENRIKWFKLNLQREKQNFFEAAHNFLINFEMIEGISPGTLSKFQSVYTIASTYSHWNISSTERVLMTLQKSWKKKNMLKCFIYLLIKVHLSYL